MRPFEEIWSYTCTLPGYYVPEQGRHLYDAACASPGDMVEIGTFLGKSASVLGAAALQTGRRLTCVDPWPERFEETLKNLRPFNAKLLRMTSVEASLYLSGLFGLVHIDGEHQNIDGAGPDLDCELWLPKLMSGGFACFHDYWPDFPDVREAVDQWTRGWEFVGNFERLAVRRKP